MRKATRLIINEKKNKIIEKTNKINEKERDL